MPPTSNGRGRADSEGIAGAVLVAEGRAGGSGIEERGPEPIPD